MGEADRGGERAAFAVEGALLDEETNRGKRNSIPMRPDHGHLMDEEMNKPGVRPGYSYAGRMKSLAELRGVIHVLERLRAAG